MNDVVIKAEGLGKKYMIGHKLTERVPTLRDSIARSASNFVRGAGDMLRGRPIYGGDEIEEFWALRGLDFQINRGDVVGIIGRNGAGKSTLLKVLSRITEPSEGRVEIKGRVASLLEVGTGFHPELTGRENIFLNGAILGMTRSEIQRKFDEIVDFAEVEKFLDTPVKRYSSGMYVRLAFSVAAHLEPEILVVDEVLAVGDLEFQRKCLGKMQDVSGDGRTVLFVSHNMSSIQALCQKAILLKRGEIECSGDLDVVISKYLLRENTVQILDLREVQKHGREIISLQSAELSAPGEGDDCLSFEVTFEVHHPINNLRVGLILKSGKGEEIFEAYDTDNQTIDRLVSPGEYSSRCKIPTGLLGAGTFAASVNVGIPGERNIIFAEDVLQVDVIGPPRDGMSSYPRRGVCSPELAWVRERG